jgi:opacity protein-like surface antigen
MLYHVPSDLQDRLEKFSPDQTVISSVKLNALLTTNAQVGQFAAGKSLAYNIGAAGVGVDYRLLYSVNVRVEYEFQKWFGFPPNDLSPQVLGIGASYRFH